MVEPRGLEVAADWRTLRSPETYLGYGQAAGFASGRAARFDEPRTATPRRRACRSTTGTSRGPGPSREHAAVLERAGRPDRLPVPRPRRQPGHGPGPGRRRSRSASSSTGEPRTAPPGPTSTPTAGDARRAAHLPADPPAGPIAERRSRSSSSTQAPRRTASPSADSAQPDPRQEERHTHHPARWNNARLRADAPCSRRGRSRRVRPLTGCSSSLVPAAVWCPPRPCGPDRAARPARHWCATASGASAYS